MNGFLTDLKSGFRILIRSPGPAALAVLILAVGIGLSTAMFSIVYGVVLRGLPIHDADELMHVEASKVQQGSRAQKVTLFQFLDWQREQSSFQSLHAFQTFAVYVAGEGLPERLEAAGITPGAFGHLGIAPALGREFLPEDAKQGAESVAVLGHRVWRDRFGADSEALGKTLRVDGRIATVIGVMPEGFQFPERQEIWLPQMLDTGVLLRRDAESSLDVFGRLNDGVDSTVARDDLDAICARMAERHPDTATGLRAVVKPFGRHFIGAEEVNLSWTSLGAVCFVLLIACFNVANLLLARASRRAREMALRAALGAGRWRMARQILAESFAIAVVAALAGLGLASVLVQRFNLAVAEQEWPFWINIALDWHAFYFVFGCTAVVALVAGALPAWRSSLLDISAVLQDEARGSHRGRLAASLVIAEVALSCTLLVGAGLMARTLLNLATLDFAFNVENVYAGRITLVSSAYPDRESIGRSWEELEIRLDTVPGVERAALADRAPAAEWAPMLPYEIDRLVADDPQNPPRVRRVIVSRGFFAALGVESLAGRVLDASDRQTSLPVAVVNRSFAEAHWGESGALGRAFRFGTGAQAEAWRTVVGVVPDINAGGFGDERPQAVYVPLTQSLTRSAVLLARVRGSVETVARDIRNTVADFDQDLPIYFAGALRDKVTQQLFFYHMVGAIFSIMAFVALLLAASGLYGLLSFAVSQRTSEVGVRLALGASPRDILFLIVGQGVRWVMMGLAVGLLMALALSRLLEQQLFGVDPFDLLTFVTVALTLLASGVLASVLPARRASCVDPVEALRSE